MHIDDIHAAIENNNTKTIQDAFRALIGWPNEDTIKGSTAAARAKLLDAVCKALEDDGDLMPRDTLEAIMEVSDELQDGTYADGAEAVLAARAHWTHQRKAKP